MDGSLIGVNNHARKRVNQQHDCAMMFKQQMKAGLVVPQRCRRQIRLALIALVLLPPDQRRPTQRH